MEQECVLKFIECVDWTSLSRTYGSFHSTIIGLFVRAWTQLGEKYTALEGPPSFNNNGLRNHPDAILVKNNEPAIILEVEGEKVSEVYNKFEYYFQNLDNVQGICVIYPYFLRGPRDNKRWRFCKGNVNGDGWFLPKFEKCMDEKLTIVKLEKNWNGIPPGFNNWDKKIPEYSQAQLARVIGYRIISKKQLVEDQIWPKNMSE